MTRQTVVLAIMLVRDFAQRLARNIFFWFGVVAIGYWVILPAFLSGLDVAVVIFVLLGTIFATGFVAGYYHKEKE